MENEVEIWKDIAGYEGLYQVSNLGRVKSLPKIIESDNKKYHLKEKVLKYSLDTCGYTQVKLYKDKNSKNFKVHRLVATVFIPNPDNLKEINHKDEDKTNNRIENLEWCTRIYNMNYGTARARANRKLINHPSKSKPVLCVELNRAFPSAMGAGRFLKKDYAFSNILQCCYFKRNIAYGYHWKFVD